MPACQRLNLHFKCAESGERNYRYLLSAAADAYVPPPPACCVWKGAISLGRNSTRKMSCRCSRRRVLEGEKRMRTRMHGERERKIFFAKSLARDFTL